MRTGTILMGALLGLAIGVAAYTFIYAKGGSYLTNDPAACANCHVMEEHYSGWIKSSHRSVAACNDCHTPPDFFGKYATKASNGFWHSFAFTTGDYPDPLRIKQHNREVTESACRGCHAEIVQAIDAPTGMPASAAGSHPVAEGTSCVRCHARVGHWVR
jgi:cytochrome c nitrite reductase small subunit